MKKDLMFILDNNYIEQFLVTVHSIFENNKPEEITVHVIYVDIDDKNIQLINDYIKKNNAKVILYRGNSHILDTDKMSVSYWSDLMYYKFYGMFHIEGVPKILYLDCDIIVDGNLDEFFKIPMEDNYVLAVEDTGLWQVLWSLEEHYRKLKLPANYRYINAGVMMLNIERIRQEVSLDDIIQQYILFAKRLSFCEQDLINIMWQNKIKIVDRKYNRVATDFQYRKKIYKDDSVIIYHYTSQKPWSDELIKNRYAYSWCVKKYMQYANFAECENLRKKVLRYNKFKYKIKCKIKSRFGIIDGFPLKTKSKLDYIIHKL